MSRCSGVTYPLLSKQLNGFDITIYLRNTFKVSINNYIFDKKEELWPLIRSLWKERGVLLSYQAESLHLIQISEGIAIAKNL